MKTLARSLAFAASASIAASPCLAGNPRLDFDAGERRSSATAGVYFAVPFGGERNGRAQGGLRLRMTHDYRSPASPQARVINADTLELRLIGEQRPTVFVADRPITGRDNRQNLMGGGIVGIVVIGLAVVGAVVVYSAIHDGDDDDAVPN